MPSPSPCRTTTLRPFDGSLGVCAQCGKSEDTAWSEAAAQALCLRCYRQLPSAQYQPPAERPVRLTASQRPQASRNAHFIKPTWDRIEQLTGHAPFYVDATHITSYCPVCLTGTITIAFTSHPRPNAFPSSLGGGPGCCSDGCTAVAIAQAVAR